MAYDTHHFITIRNAGNHYRSYSCHRENCWGVSSTAVSAGSSGLLPKNSTDLLAKAKMPAGTLTIQLYLSATKGEFGVAFGIAVVLLLIVLGINLLTKALAKKFDVNRR